MKKKITTEYPDLPIMDPSTGKPLEHDDTWRGTRWEYMWVAERDIIDEINRLGLEGWEMCGVEPDTRTMMGGQVVTTFTYIFKRPKDE